MSQGHVNRAERRECSSHIQALWLHFRRTMSNRILIPIPMLFLGACGDDAPIQPDAGTTMTEPDAAVCITPRTPDPDPAFEALLQQLETRMAQSAIPGGAIAILRNGGTSVQSAVLGVKQRDSCDEITPATRFKLGPITELFTAVAVLAAADQNLLQLNDPVANHIPLTLTGGSASSIEIRHLLTHSDGLPTTWINACEGADLATWWSSRSTQPMWFPAGALGQWGMNAPQTAGRVLEVATGKPFATAVNDLVFAPLGTSATYDVAAVVGGDYATPHGFGGIPAEPVECGAARPSGQLFASLDDLIKLGRFVAWGNPSVMSSGMFTTFVDGGGEPAIYYGDRAGYGITTVDAGGYDVRLQVGWGGGVTALAYVPHVDAMLVLVLNKEVADFEKNGFNDAIKAIAGSLAPPVTTTAASTWGEYAGAAYTDALSSPSRTLTIQLANSTLSGSLTIGSSTIPVAFAPTDFADMFRVTYGTKTELVRFWRPSPGAAPNRITGVDWRFGPPFSR